MFNAMLKSALLASLLLLAVSCKSLQQDVPSTVGNPYLP